MKIFQFPITKNPHYATIKDKKRNSGLTSCRFFQEDIVVACDFNEHKTYLVEIFGDEIKIIDSHDTITASGIDVETDLMDLRGNRFIVSNFYQGSVGLYQIISGKINFIKEINLSVDKTNMHGVRFIPGYDNLIWVAYCGIKNKCHEIWDIENEIIIYSFEESEQCQDIAFLGFYAVIFARTDHIWVNDKPKWYSRKNKMYATAYIYDFKDLLTKRPHRISKWRGEGHIDATVEYKGLIYGANQYLDRVDVFRLDDNAQLSLIKSIPDFGMPHGLDVKNGKILVTNYADQTMRLMKINDIKV